MLKKFLGSLYGQVIVGLGLGILVGVMFPAAVENRWVLFDRWTVDFARVGTWVKPLSDLFINAIKMVIGPIILCTVAVGIARVGSAKAIGRLGGKSILYFEIVTTIALLIGLIIGNLVQPGANFPADAAARMDQGAVDAVVKGRHAATELIPFLVGLVPSNIVDALAKGEIVQVLVFAILFGLALASMGKKAELVVNGVDQLGHALLRVVGLVMRLAPLAAFGAMAHTISTFGLESLKSLGLLIACLYGAAAIFLLGVIWPICAYFGRVSMWKLIVYLKEEVFITLGTASSEAVLPRMLEKMEKLGAGKQTVGFVIPAGYSFNLAGSSIYMTLAPLFIAQALHIPFTLEQQIGMFAILLLTSKGIAGVAGASLVVLVTTLETTAVLPVAAVSLILGIDRIQNEIRSLTNLIGNAVATVVLARSEKDFDLERAHRVLNGQVDVEATLESGEEITEDGIKSVTAEKA